MYYNLRLGSGCNLGKDLSKRWELSQLVKYKDTGQYLLLYIHIDNEVKAWWLYVNDVREYKKT